MKVGILCGEARLDPGWAHGQCCFGDALEAYNDSNNPGSNTRRERNESEKLGVVEVDTPSDLCREMLNTAEYSRSNPCSHESCHACKIVHHAHAFPGKDSALLAV